ncbi:MAG: acyltransferase [Theionarchaea archaeon]|nr:acyltransferase [Theionarchaea archaeon]
MSRRVTCGLIQASWPGDVEEMIQKHEKLVDEAGKKGVHILCLQELFHGPYFPAEQDARWYALAEKVPGPTTRRIAAVAQNYDMAVIIPVYEEEMTGLYYNTAAVYDADGTYLGKYRKTHIPNVGVFMEKFYFAPGNSGFPVFNTRYARIGVSLCYDRHFPEGPRILGLKGAEILFNPSATVASAGLSKYLWELELPAHAVANGYFIAGINRVGEEPPWNIGTFYGSSYFCDPTGQIIVRGGDRDEVVVADLDLDRIREVQHMWQFYRDRRPENYTKITER